LAQRLYRILHGWPKFIAWATLKGQFGTGYDRMNKFRAVLHVALLQVLAYYPTAEVERYNLVQRSAAREKRS